MLRSVCRVAEKKGLIQMYGVYHLSIVLSWQLSRAMPADGSSPHDKAACPWKH